MIDNTLIELVDSGSDVVGYLKTLKLKERKNLHESNLVLANKYFPQSAGENIGRRIWKENPEKAKAIILTAFSYMGKRDFYKILNFTSFKVNYVIEILRWYKPRWIDSFVIDFSRQFNYLKLVECVEKGLLDIGIDTFAVALQCDASEGNIFELCTTHKITLKEHIWGLINSDLYISELWEEPLIKFIVEEKIKRSKLIEELTNCLYNDLSTRNSESRIEQYAKIKPDESEILKIQAELFGLLQSDKTNIRAFSLSQLKKIAKHKRFNVSEFIEKGEAAVQSHLVSDIKSVLGIIKLAIGNRKAQKSQLAKMALCGFSIRNENTQQLAKDIILKYCTPDNDISEEILAEKKTIFGNVFQDLEKHFGIKSEEIILSSQSYDFENILSEINEIKKVESIEELLQYFNNVETGIAYPEVLFVYSSLRDLIPILQSKDSEYVNVFCANLPYLDGCFKEAYRFIQHLLYDLNLYTSEINPFREISRNVFWGCRSKYRFEIFDHLSRYIYKYLQHPDKIELLSTPTHYPCFIDPSVFLQRLVNLQEKNIDIHLYDFQIAIQRLPKPCIKEIRKDDIEKITNPEIKAVLNYICEKIEFDIKLVKNPGLWISSILYRKDNVAVKILEQTYSTTLKLESTNFNWHYGNFELKYREGSFSKNGIKCYQPGTYNIVENHIKFDGYFDTQHVPYYRHFADLNGDYETWYTIGGYETFDIDSYFKFFKFSIEQYNYLYRSVTISLLSLVPNQPSSVLIIIVRLLLSDPNRLGKSNLETIIGTLQYLPQIWYRDDFGEITYLFITCCFLSKNTTIRNLASELWIAANSKKLFNNRIFSKCWSKLHASEYTPSSRFTSQTMKSLMNVSSYHNEQLELIYKSFILNSNLESPKEKSKLLKVYKEIISLTKNDISDEVIEKLV